MNANYAITLSKFMVPKMSEIFESSFATVGNQTSFRTKTIFSREYRVGTVPYFFFITIFFLKNKEKL